MAKSVLDLGLALSLDQRAQRKLAKQIRKDLSKIDIGLDHTKLAKTLESVAGDVEDLIAEATEKGFAGVDGDGLTKAVSRYTRDAQQATEKIAALEAKLAEKGISEAQRQALKNQQELHADRLKKVDSEFKARFKQEKEAYAEFDKAIERARELTGATATEFTTKLSQGFNQAADSLITSIRSGDFAGFLKGLGEAGESFGAGLEARGAVAGSKADARATGDMAVQAGKLLKSLGKAAMLAGAVAGAFAAVVKLMIDADSQAKEFNKTLMEGVGAADLYAANFTDVADTMDVARDAAVDFRRNLMLGTTAQETLETLRAYAAAGLVFEEIAGDAADAADQIDRLQRASDLALTYSRLTGMSTQETAEHMSRMVEEFGITLDGVAGRFSNVLDAAMMSGFGVNRFYSMVLQATSGMAIYNSRLEETAGLLVMLGNILGSDMAGEFVQQLQRGFADEGMTDRFRRVMTTGTDRMQDIFRRSAVDTAEGFLQNLNERGLGDIFSSVGLEMDPQSLVEGLAGMTSDARSELLARVRGADADLARQLRTLINVSEGTQGSLDALARNMGSLDAGGRLSAMLNSASAIFSAPIHELNATQLAGFESIAGISGQELEQLRAISEGVHGNFNQLRHLQATGARLSESEVRAFGAAINANGDIVSAHVDELGNIVMDQTPIDSIEDYIQSQGDSLAESMGEGVAEELILSREIASNIMDLSQVIENGVQYVLEQIYSEMRVIGDLIAGFTGRGSFVRQRRDALASSQEGIASKRGELQTLQEELTGLTRRRDAATGEERVALTQQIEEQTRAMEGVRAGLDLMQIRQNELRAAYDEEALSAAMRGGSDAERDWLLSQGSFSDRVVTERDRTEAELRLVQDRISDLMENGVQVVAGQGQSMHLATRTGADALTELLRDPALQQEVFAGTGLSIQRGAVVDGGPLGVGGTPTFDIMRGAHALTSVQQIGHTSTAGFDLADMSSIDDTATAESIAAIGDEVISGNADTLRDLSREEQLGNRQRDRQFDQSRIAAAEEGAGVITDYFRRMDNLALAEELAKFQNRSINAAYDDMQRDGFALPAGFTPQSDMARSAARVLQQANDFIYRRDGTITPINRSDEIMGYRPGGPIERSSRGGGAPVNVHIHGGDEGRIYNVLNRVLRTAGYGPSKVSGSA